MSDKHTHVLNDGTVISHSHEDTVPHLHHDIHSNIEETHIDNELGRHKENILAHEKSPASEYDSSHEHYHEHNHCNVGEHIHEHEHNHCNVGEHIHEHEHNHEHVHEHDSNHVHSHGHHHANTKAVLNRMSRAIGHMESIKTMVENGRDCTEVLIQIAAVRSAINNIGKIILEDHINHCIVDAIETGDQKALDDLNEAINKFIK